MSTSLSYFTAFLLGDGRKGPVSIDFYNDNRKMLRKIENIGVALFGAKPLYVRHKDDKHQELCFKGLSPFFDYLGTGTVRDKKRIPDSIISGTREIVAAFIAGFLDSDGCVFPHGFGLYQKTPTMLRDIQRMCLAHFNVLPALHVDSEGSVLLFSTDTAHKLKPFVNKYATKKIVAACSKTRPQQSRIIPKAYNSIKQVTSLNGKYLVEGNYVTLALQKLMNPQIRSTDSVERLEDLEKVSPRLAKRLRRLLNSGYHFDTVAESKKCGWINTGDISIVDGRKNYVAGGLLTHNTLYEVMPISNPPKFTQETARIRTIVEGKQQPLIKHFIEDFGISRGCFRTCLFKGYLPMKFRMDPKTKEEAFSYANGGKKKKAVEGVQIY
jgi:hypothetical protein